jgi:hypothetical protein
LVAGVDCGWLFPLSHSDLKLQAGDTRQDDCSIVVGRTFSANINNLFTFSIVLLFPSVKA